MAQPKLSVGVGIPNSMNVLHIAAIQLALSASILAAGPAARIVVHAEKALFRVSDLMLGANMEDLHYQMTGGLSSQLIHGESFLEPTPVEIARQCQPFEAFTVREGSWTSDGDVLRVAGVQPDSGNDGVAVPTALRSAAGARLSSTAVSGTVTETAVEVLFAKGAKGAAGLALRIHPNEADQKWSWFAGYTVELNPGTQQVELKRAEKPSRFVVVASSPCRVNPGAWTALAVRFAEKRIAIAVNGTEALQWTDENLLPQGRMGLVAHGEAQFRNLREIAANGDVRPVVFRPNPLLAGGDAISLRWAAVRTGSAEGGYAHEVTDGWLPGKPSQTFSFVRGEGEWGIENAGLARWGLSLAKGLPYEGFLRVKSAGAVELFVSLRSADGKAVYASQALSLKGGNQWERPSFVLTPSRADSNARFAITLRKPGTVTAGYAFLQPGGWGRFKGLPVRKDLAEAVIAQGSRVLRMNGGMIERSDYRWANMQGPRDSRPPYDGFYDRWCGNGFGLIEFLQFCEAAQIIPVPALNLDETPESVADFVAYATAPADSAPGLRRAKDGHPAPFALPYYQVANESYFNRAYVDKFKRVAEAVWKVAPGITLVTTSTGPIGEKDDEPAIRTKTALHAELIDFVQSRGKKLLFDSHAFKGAAAIAKIAAFGRWVGRSSKHPGDVSVGVLEFNAGAFDHQRGLSHAMELNAAWRAGDVIRAVGTPNLSQPWNVYQTDWKAVLWTQGNIYYTQDKVWFQSAYYVDQMIARHWAPDALTASVEGGSKLDVFASKSADGRALVLRIVNPSQEPVLAQIVLDGFTPHESQAFVEELAGAPREFNTLEEPRRINPVTRSEPLPPGKSSHRFAPYSFTLIEWK